MTRAPAARSIHHDTSPPARFGTPQPPTCHIPRQPQPATGGPADLPPCSETRVEHCLTHCPLRMDARSRRILERGTAGNDRQAGVLAGRAPRHARRPAPVCSERRFTRKIKPKLDDNTYTPLCASRAGRERDSSCGRTASRDCAPHRGAACTFRVARQHARSALYQCVHQ